MTTLRGDEPFCAGDAHLDFTLLDYWRWSGSDLLDNTERGVLAEFLVAKALGVADEPRVEWAAHDVSASFDGKPVAVEVKSAAWYQSWDQHQAQPSPSAIRFDIAPRKWSWDPKTNESVELSEPQRAADVYVFCVLGNDDGSKPNPSISTSGISTSSIPPASTANCRNRKRSASSRCASWWRRRPGVAR